MGGDPASSGYLLDRAPLLLRVAHQLTGDPAAAGDALCRAAVRFPAGGGGDVDLDRVAATALVRATRRAAVASTDTDLDWLSHRARTAVVLAFGHSWDAASIAEVIGVPVQRVRRDVASALSHRPETHWRDLLDDGRWALPVPANLLDRVVATRRQRRRGRDTAMLAAAVVVTLLASVTVATVRIAQAPPPLPPTAEAPGLLHWTPRGPLIRDERFIDRAVRVWLNAAAPTGGVYVLWAGEIGVGRAAVLQGLLSDGDALIALVAERDVTFNHPRLQLEGVWPLNDPDGPAVVIPYDGNLGIPGLEAGPGSRVVQLLVAPDVVRVESRALRNLSPMRPEFEAERLRNGMSSPWLDLTDSTNAAVRLIRDDGTTFTGLLPDGDIQLAALERQVEAAPTEWAGLEVTDPGLLVDDAVWWAQLCRSPATEVQLVWQRRVPAFTAPIRLEFVTCPGERPVAHFLTGVGAGTHELSASARAADAYWVDLVPTAGGPASVAVVGSQRVASIRGPDGPVGSRVAVVPIDQAPDLRILDAQGHEVAVG
jgi:hypothetical protein